MTLADIRDYIASLEVSEHVYMGKLPDKQDESIGVYNSKHQYSYHTALGGPAQEGYGPCLTHSDRQGILRPIMKQLNLFSRFMNLRMSERMIPAFMKW